MQDNEKKDDSFDETNDNAKLQEEMDKLDIEILPTPKIDNIKSDLTFKLIVVGNAGVGKSCLSLKGTTGRFEDSYVATVGFDFYSFFARIENQLIRLQVWDTCGQEGYRSLVQNFYRGTSLAILVYAINDIKSFNDVGTWVKQLKAYSNPDVKMFLVGNKNDLENERKITSEMGQKYQRDLDFFCFYETSAKTGVNSQEIFVRAMKLLYVNYKRLNSENAGKNKKKGNNQKLGKEMFDKEKRKRKKDCCK